MFTHGPVSSMLAVSSHYILVATYQQRLYLLQAPALAVITKPLVLQDSALCLLRCRG